MEDGVSGTPGPPGSEAEAETSPEVGLTCGHLKEHLHSGGRPELGRGLACLCTAWLRVVTLPQGLEWRKFPYHNLWETKAS